MVKKINGFYQCGICLLKYNNREIAGKCEEWCKKYNSCSLNITKHAVKRD